MKYFCHTLPALFLALLCTHFALAQDAATPTKTRELNPLIMADGKLSGEAGVSIDVAADGSVAKVTAVSGSKDMQKDAVRVAKYFRHPDCAGLMGLNQRIIFQSGEIKKVNPVYPPMAKAAHVSGTVEAVATVGTDGHAKNVTVVLGPPMLQEAGKKAVQQWVFAPVSRDGQPIETSAIVDLHFEIITGGFR